jgi:NAD(P)H dehydrogenase (quinone)
MPKILVPYYSSYCNIGHMAQAVAAVARETGATEDVKRVPQTAPEDVARAADFKLEQAAPVASVTDLENYDAIIIGTPTRCCILFFGLFGVFDWDRLTDRTGTIGQTASS